MLIERTGRGGNTAALFHYPCARRLKTGSIPIPVATAVKRILTYIWITRLRSPWSSVRSCFKNIAIVCRYVDRASAILNDRGRLSDRSTRRSEVCIAAFEDASRCGAASVQAAKWHREDSRLRRETHKRRLARHYHPERRNLRQSAALRKFHCHVRIPRPVTPIRRARPQ